MKYLILLIPIFFVLSTMSQNVGQKGDSLINYTDINGFKQGFWQQKYYNGEIRYEGYFKNDKPYGEFKRYDNRGRITSLLNYSMNGDTAHATLYHENGNIAAVGKYINKIKDGEWKYYNEDGKLITVETYDLETKDGPFIVYYEDGKVYEEKNYANGELDGEKIRYYSNGQINYKALYRNGRRVGDFFVYDVDGKVLVYGKYVDDKRHGTWRFYEESGEFKGEIKYNYGIPENKEELEIQETKKLEELEKNKNTIDDPANFIENPEQYMFMKREKK